MSTYQSLKDHTLTLKDLKEGHVYTATLSVNHKVMINHCHYKIINGKLHLHRAANWEDVPTTDLSDSAFLEEVFEWPDAPCFKFVV